MAIAGVSTGLGRRVYAAAAEAQDAPDRPELDAMQCPEGILNGRKPGTVFDRFGPQHTDPGQDTGERRDTARYDMESDVLERAWQAWKEAVGAKGKEVAGAKGIDGQESLADGLQQADDTGTQNADAAEDVVFSTHSMTLREMLAKRINEIVEKLQEGVAEPSFLIGASSFTLEEWENFLKLFDRIEEEMKKAAGQEVPPESTGVAAEETAAAETDGNLLMLLAETTSCTYPVSEETEDVRYITYYTREGIYCRKEGEFGYEWVIPMEEDQYDQVIAFLSRFDGEDNLRFACHENFWQDFLNGTLDLEGFMDFMDHRVSGGIPNYVNVDGDSMWIDAEAAGYAQYMNKPGLFIPYSPEALMMGQKARML